MKKFFFFENRNAVRRACFSYLYDHGALDEKELDELRQ